MDNRNDEASQLRGYRWRTLVSPWCADGRFVAFMKVPVAKEITVLETVRFTRPPLRKAS